MMSAAPQVMAAGGAATPTPTGSAQGALAPPPDREAARRHFDRGEKLFAVGRFADALAEYQLAYQALPAPEFLFNIGQCHRNLDNFDEAIFAFSKFLELRPDAPNRPAVETLIAELEHKKQERDAQKLIAAPPPLAHPVYKKWWFWTGIAVVAIGAGIGGYLIFHKDGGLPDTDLGNVPLGSQQAGRQAP